MTVKTLIEELSSLSDRTKNLKVAFQIEDSLFEVESLGIRAGLNMSKPDIEKLGVTEVLVLWD